MINEKEKFSEIIFVFFMVQALTSFCWQFVAQFFRRCDRCVVNIINRVSRVQQVQYEPLGGPVPKILLLRSFLKKLQIFFTVARLIVWLIMLQLNQIKVGNFCMVGCSVIEIFEFGYLFLFDSAHNIVCQDVQGLVPIFVQYIKLKTSFCFQFCREKKKKKKKQQKNKHIKQNL
eukprot:TRINITY_DN2978_c0_g1_i10.p2 TRINITY_DN2978_c0_g1~~TRINITY_DN2978_c0_g1_i10.p2  ORF type:complete len:174 (-),score=2.50 TRINITY_DN2978_c0_g1_i10:43-564(-)